MRTVVVEREAEVDYDDHIMVMAPECCRVAAAKAVVLVKDGDRLIERTTYGMVPMSDEQVKG